jgi:hypothetical protein
VSYATFSIDRRAEYYARIADLIAADPLDFYTRAERGRKLLAVWLILWRPREVPRPVAESPALPCEAAGDGVVVRMRRKAR